MPSLLGRVKTQLGREQISLVSLAIAYVVTGKIGLVLQAAFGSVHPASTAIFPPAGIALGGQDMCRAHDLAEFRDHILA